MRRGGKQVEGRWGCLIVIVRYEYELEHTCLEVESELGDVEDLRDHDL